MIGASYSQGKLEHWQPLADGVLIKRLEPIEQQRGSEIVLTDMKQDGKMLLRKGKVLAVGPGKRDEDGYRIEPEVKPGDLVLFNARWNDLADAELRPVGADRNSRTAPLERPLSWRFEKDIHLVQEADIAGILA
jgi:co-chaperonin GroES (HSP10)